MKTPARTARRLLASGVGLVLTLLIILAWLEAL